MLGFRSVFLLLESRFRSTPYGSVTLLKTTKGNKQKMYFFSGPATKRGEGGKGLATKKKYLFLKLDKKIPTNVVATKFEGAGPGH